MSVEASVPDFTCSDCGSPSIRIDGALSSSTQVYCDGCNKYFCDWSDFVSKNGSLARPQCDARRSKGQHDGRATLTIRDPAGACITCRYVGAAGVSGQAATPVLFNHNGAERAQDARHAQDAALGQNGCDPEPNTERSAVAAIAN